MVSLVMMLVGGVWFDERINNINNVNIGFSTLCSSLEPTIILFRPMERQVDLLSL